MLCFVAQSSNSRQSSLSTIRHLIFHVSEKSIFTNILCRSDAAYSINNRDKILIQNNFPLMWLHHVNKTLSQLCIIQSKLKFYIIIFHCIQWNLMLGFSRNYLTFYVHSCDQNEGSFTCPETPSKMFYDGSVFRLSQVRDNVKTYKVIDD